MVEAGQCLIEAVWCGPQYPMSIPCVSLSETRRLHAMACPPQYNASLDTYDEGHSLYDDKDLAGDCFIQKEGEG